MALVAQYDVELHQMDVKTTDLYENVYIVQPKDFVMEDKENLGCRLKKLIYGLKANLKAIEIWWDNTKVWI